MTHNYNLYVIGGVSGLTAELATLPIDTMKVRQ